MFDRQAAPCVDAKDGVVCLRDVDDRHQCEKPPNVVFLGSYGEPLLTASPFVTRPPPAAPACEKLLLGRFNGETLVWEKVAKSWEKRALSLRGREGVNHERTCL